MTTMTLQEKEAVRDLLKGYCGRYSSQNKAAASLNGVSAGTLSMILNSKFDNISDEMFRNLRAQISTVSTTGEWQIVETPAFKDIHFALKNAQELSDVTWIIAPAGSGKTETALRYRSENDRVYYLLCDEDMRKHDFIRELAQAIGIKVKKSARVRDILMLIISVLSDEDSPLLIFDEGDKLSDSILYYFISLYNRLKYKAGIVFLSTSYMQRRMQTGVSYDKKGYQEIESRIGRKFYMAEPVTPNDVYTIARANGINDDATLSRIIKDAETCKFDLRRVHKKVNAEKKKRQAIN
jgi:hypothetical protein